jgi:hypothetical protein
MSRPMLQIFAAVAAIAAIAIAFAACGDSGASQEELDRARREGVAKARQQAKIDDIEKQLKSLRKNGSASQGSPPPSAASTTSSGGSTSCGGSLSVGPNTTCGFAANVEADYYSDVGTGSGTVYSYSPTTGQYYTMYCTAGSPHVCTGGHDASVYFP